MSVLSLRKHSAGAFVARIAIALLLGVLVVGCDSTSAASRTIALQTLNDSGVTGTVTFSPAGQKTSVQITVEPAGNLDMPAHIHPGTCDALTPQPKFPLENVKDGSSSTIVPASIDELFAGSLAFNIHKSNDDLRTYTACVDIE